MAIWGVTAVFIFVGYRPPKRHTRYDHLSFFQKMAKLDLPGFVLFTAGLALFLTGLNLGGELYTWTSSKTLGTLVSGIITLIGFGIYEWKGTSVGIVNHDLFRGGRSYGGSYAIYAALMFIEGIMLFAYTIFYPVL